MADYQSVAPTADPVSVAKVKSHLNLTASDDDEWIEDRIKAATTMLEARMNRAFIHQTRVLKMRTFGDERYVHSRRIYLPRSPLSSVSSIQYVASDGTTTTLPTSDYIVSAYETPARVSEAYNATWPDTRVMDDNVTVTYIAGHSSSSTGIPHNIKQAVCMLVGHWYRNREAASEQSMSEIPLGLDALLYGENIETYG
jgi:uncharacterized phiE125 gp8 family phage protein